MVFMQGTSDSNPELLDALAMCGHLVARDSVHWFLAEHRCQGPIVSARRRSVELPVGGHQNCPLVANGTAR